MNIKIPPHKTIDDYYEKKSKLKEQGNNRKPPKDTKSRKTDSGKPRYNTCGVDGNGQNGFQAEQGGAARRGPFAKEVKNPPGATMGKPIVFYANPDYDRRSNMTSDERGEEDKKNWFNNRQDIINRRRESDDDKENARRLGLNLNAYRKQYKKADKKEIATITGKSYLPTLGTLTIPVNIPEKARNYDKEFEEAVEQDGIDNPKPGVWNPNVTITIIDPGGGRSDIKTNGNNLNTLN